MECKNFQFLKNLAFSNSFRGRGSTHVVWCIFSLSGHQKKKVNFDEKIQVNVLKSIKTSKIGPGHATNTFMAQSEPKPKRPVDSNLELFFEKFL